MLRRTVGAFPQGVSVSTLVAWLEVGVWRTACAVGGARREADGDGDDPDQSVTHGRESGRSGRPVVIGRTRLAAAAVEAFDSVWGAASFGPGVGGRLAGDGTARHEWA